MPQVKYPIGAYSFSAIREGGYVYVDKTGYLHDLLHRGYKNVLLSSWEVNYGIDNGECRHIGISFERLIQAIHEKCGRRLVVLVDEYDKPLLESVDNHEPQSQYSSVLRAFYGKAEDFMLRLQGLFSDFDQGGFNRIGLERHYQDVICIIMKLMGFYTHIEYKTASGRIDLAVKTPEYVYVFELKLDKTAQEAIGQINGKDCLLPFNVESRSLIKIGANFYGKTRMLNEWIIERIN